VSGELFTARKGHGAELNGRPVRVSGSRAVSESLLVTGFPYNFEEILDAVIGRFRSCLRASRGVRRLGAAALDLCFVACGRFDGFWEENLKPWDTAAGMLIAAEAGGRVTDFKGKAFVPDDLEILATNGRIHRELMSLLELKEK
jgi:myo-inositol-1(or 4)-monophosphatase